MSDYFSIWSLKWLVTHVYVNTSNYSLRWKDEARQGITTNKNIVSTVKCMKHRTHNVNFTHVRNVYSYTPKMLLITFFILRQYNLLMFLFFLQRSKSKCDTWTLFVYFHFCLHDSRKLTLFCLWICQFYSLLWHTTLILSNNVKSIALKATCTSIPGSHIVGN